MIGPRFIKLLRNNIFKIFFKIRIKVDYYNEISNIFNGRLLYSNIKWFKIIVRHNYKLYLCQA